MQTQRSQMISEQRSSITPWLVVYSQTKPRKYLGLLVRLIKGTGYLANQKTIESIYNINGIFGSLTSNFSACNSEAKWPPVVIDDNTGKFYGLLTLNNRMSGKIKNKAIMAWLKNEVCSV